MVRKTTVKSLPLEHLFHRGKPFLIHSVQLDYPENTEKHFSKERQNLHLHLSNLAFNIIKTYSTQETNFLLLVIVIQGGNSIYGNFCSVTTQMMNREKTFNASYESLLCTSTVSHRMQNTQPQKDGALISYLSLVFPISKCFECYRSSQTNSRNSKNLS